MNLNGLKILIIDDSATISRAAEIYLKGPAENPTGIITKTAGDGFDALPAIKEFMPDIVFLDVVLPKLNGFTICKVIKDHPKYRHIKVIMLTSKDGLFDRARAVDAGADSHVSKPFRSDTLLSIVEQYVPDRFKSA